ncbi:MAG TPA: Uma2 family endonuclease [Candidatus Margulisiibacteriota bacterium]|nr:Uma2 family endonuclease [Candidatus Margulisiibacteriota bacterium]
MTIAERYEETIPVPRAIRFPVELIPPEGFDPERLETWPRVEGRLEFVKGRLLFMPPCGQMQSYTVGGIVTVLGLWVRTHPEFAVGTNEAGLLVHGEARGLDAGIWRRQDASAVRHQFQRVPPILAVEVAGEDENERVLRDKAAWYLGAGVQVVWIVVPEQREVIVVTGSGEHRCRVGETLPAHPALPDLTPLVDEFFVQISAQ